MTDRLDFETRLEKRLRARAAIASRPFDAAVIARQAVAAGGRRRGFGGLGWPSTRPASRWLVVALLLAIALLGVVAGIGALLRQGPVPQLGVSNGWIAVSANSWGFGGGENGDIYVVSEGTSPRRIIGSDGDAVAQACPRISPEGRRLAYGEARASGTVTSFRGAWPVDDRAIVVVGVSDRGDPSAPLARVTVPAGQGPMVCPEWSPTGQHVAFRVGAELWIADSASGATRVVQIASVIGRQENELEWSRDGSMIAVGEPGQIRVVHIDGGAPTIIKVEGATPRTLGWTARDERIVYISVVPVGEYGSAVHVVYVDGTHDTRLTPIASAPGLTFSFDEAAVSPDGTRVAYVQGASQCGGDGCGPVAKLKPIVIAALDGSSRVEMSVPSDGRLPKASDGSGFFVSGLQWSPDGKHLLLSSIVGVISVGLEPGSAAIVYLTGTLDEGLNLEWSWSEVTWQPVPR